MLVLCLRRTALKPVLMVAALIGALAFATVASQAADPLPSWNDGPAKQSIINFVEKVTKPGAPDFVPLGERIVTFDNDGTLWCEQPVPVQLYFALDRVKALAPQRPRTRRGPAEAAVFFRDRNIVDAGLAPPHQAVLVELSLLVAVGAIPL